MNIQRAALGRNAHLGEAYDASSDTFCDGLSVLKQPIPLSIVSVTKCPDVKCVFGRANSRADRCENLGIGLEEELSILGGDALLSGSARYLNSDSCCDGTTSVCVVLKISLFSQTLDISSEAAKRILSLDDAKYSNATHVVAKITWGISLVIAISFDAKSKKEEKALSKKAASSLLAALGGRTDCIYNSVQPSQLEFYSDTTSHSHNTLKECAESVRNLIRSLNKNVEIVTPQVYTLVPLAALNSAEIRTTRVQRSIVTHGVTLGNAILKFFRNAESHETALRSFVRNISQKSLFFPKSTIRDVEARKDRCFVKLKSARRQIADNMKMYRLGNKNSTDVEGMLQIGQDILLEVDQIFMDYCFVKEQLAILTRYEDFGARVTANAELLYELVATGEHFVFITKLSLTDETFLQKCAVFEKVCRQAGEKCILFGNAQQQLSRIEDHRIVRYVEGRAMGYDVCKSEHTLQKCAGIKFYEQGTSDLESPVQGACHQTVSPNNVPKWDSDAKQREYASFCREKEVQDVSNKLGHRGCGEYDISYTGLEEKAPFEELGRKRTSEMKPNQLAPLCQPKKGILSENATQVSTMISSTSISNVPGNTVNQPLSISQCRTEDGILVSNEPVELSQEFKEREITLRRFYSTFWEKQDLFNHEMASAIMAEHEKLQDRIKAVKQRVDEDREVRKSYTSSSALIQTVIYSSESVCNEIDQFFTSFSAINKTLEYLDKCEAMGAQVVTDFSILKSFLRVGEFFVFFTKLSEVGERFAENSKTFAELCLKRIKNCILFDNDLHQLNGIENHCIVYYRDGYSVESDVCRLLSLLQDHCVIKIDKVLKQNVEKPCPRARLYVACPRMLRGSNCCIGKQEWLCYHCGEVVEYGFNMRLYCSCGESDPFSARWHCTDPNHGMNYTKFSPGLLTKALNGIQVPKERNILLFGRRGCGKSTWINSVVNYLIHDNLNTAAQYPLAYLIPSTFIIKTATNGAREITNGINEDFNLEQDTYTFMFNGELIRLIDVPSFCDGRGPEQDKENVGLILHILQTITEIHAICILLTPDVAKLTLTFRYYIQELLTYLPKSAAENIVFCFTNTRQTHYKVEQALLILKNYFLKIENSQYVISSLQSNKVYSFDNEAFRFLSAIQSGVEFSDQEQEVYRESWNVSAKETNRFLNYVLQLKPYPACEILSLNEARKIIFSLTALLDNIEENVGNNYKFVNVLWQEIEELELDLLNLHRNLPRMDNDLGTTPPYLKRKINEKAAKENLLAGYNRQTALQEKALGRITEIRARFGALWKRNSIVPYNDALLQYLDCAIRMAQVEPDVQRYGAKVKCLQSFRNRCEKVLNMLKLNLTIAPGQETLDEVVRLKQELYSMNSDDCKVFEYLELGETNVNQYRSKDKYFDVEQWSTKSQQQRRVSKLTRVTQVAYDFCGSTMGDSNVETAQDTLKSDACCGTLLAENVDHNSTGSTVRELAKMYDNSSSEGSRLGRQPNHSTYKEESSSSWYFIPPTVYWMRAKCANLRIFEDIKRPAYGVRKQFDGYSSNPTGIIPIKSDGNCGFRALSYFLTGSEIHHDTIRQAIIDFVISSADLQRLAELLPENFNADSYQLEMQPKQGSATQDRWCTDVELAAAALLFEVNIFMYDTQKRSWNIYSRDPEDRHHQDPQFPTCLIRFSSAHFELATDVAPHYN